MKTSVVVLAGGVNVIPLYPGYKPGYKALLEYHGKKSIEYVLDALAKAKNVGKIIIIGAKELKPYVKRYPLLESKGTHTPDITMALDYFKNEKEVLFTSSDIPLIKPDAFDEFIARSRKVNADIKMAIVHKKDDPYNATKAFNPSGNDSWAHGNLVMVKTDFPREKLKLMESFYGVRKQGPLSIAKVVGLQFLLFYLFKAVLTHTATVEDIAARVSARFSVKLAPVHCTHVESALDVDDPPDYELAKRVLG